jgi:hypothetical protein
VKLAALWLFQVPNHDDFSDIDWQSIDIDADFYQDALHWGTLIVDDVTLTSKFDPRVELPDPLLGATNVGICESEPAEIRLYGFGICSVRLVLDISDDVTGDDLKRVGTSLDALASPLAEIGARHLKLDGSASLTKVWSSYVLGTIAQPVVAQRVRAVVDGLTEVVPIVGDDDVYDSLVGNKFSVLNTRGAEAFERLMIRELLKLASNDREGGRAPRESVAIHNGARLLRAIWTHQFLAAPVNRRQIQSGLWTLWNMDHLVNSVTEMTEKVSAILGARRDEHRNTLTSRLNWVVLATAVMQVVLAVLAVTLSR